ncbi:unnamed protein product [Orchesella dallaii]|uniref:Uncharacterized protein n=1 Tax=Orchesella dallaii TaxID=48710 RepID=A0ABP1RPB6_9HEXA
MSNVILSEILLQPAKFHKSFFWNGNQRVIPALVYNMYNEFFRSLARNRQLICTRLIKQQSKAATFCISDLMSTVSLGDVHNITFNILDALSLREANLVSKTVSGQWLGTTVIYKNFDKLSLPEVSNHLFSYQFSEFAAYCSCESTNDIAHRNFRGDRWIAAFSLDVWLLVGFIVSGSALTMSYFNLSVFFYFELIQSLAVFMGQSLPARMYRKRKNYIVVTLCGMSLLGLYKENILSLVVTQRSPGTIDSLKELVELGFKLLIFPKVKYTFDEQKRNYWLDFKMSKALGKFNDSFYLVSERISKQNAFMKYLNCQNGGQYAALFWSRFSNLRIRTLKHSIKKRGGSENTRCYHVPQPLFPNIALSEIYTVNKYWLMTTLRRLADSGLPNKWENWSVNLAIHSQKLKSRAIKTKRRTKIGHNPINLNNLVVIFNIWIDLLLFGVVVLVCEKFCASGRYWILTEIGSVLYIFSKFTQAVLRFLIDVFFKVLLGTKVCFCLIKTVFNKVLNVSVNALVFPCVIGLRKFLY